MSRSRLYYIVCRLVIPLWLLAGALFKLMELNPKLLPPSIFAVVQFFDGAFGISGVPWLDLAIRIIVGTEIALVAVMLTMPRLARPVAIATMSLFCLILLWIIIPAFAEKGWSGAWKGSCGCFGDAGPNPIIMLMMDATLLTLAVISKRRVLGSPAPTTTFGLPSAITLTLAGAIVAYAVPARAKIVIPIVPIEPIVDPVVPPIDDPIPTTNGNDPLKPTPPPVVTPPKIAAWTGMPATAAPYYIPVFSTWLGTRFDGQEIARLMTVAPPAAINSGTWFVMFYREDCDHCHELLQAHFSGHLDVPTLTIAIPDTDPAASLEMPCGECEVRTLLKGPEYVLTTPVLMRVVNGVITSIAPDSEDRAAIERCLTP
ncbi:MAG: hypothetical protein EXS15_00485 [Phycisphaerales bacterium]|nr:hypothetical protein [Phycisphaerales bacterium]